MSLGWKAFENSVGKGENVGNQLFLFLSQCLLYFPKRISILELHLLCHLEVLKLFTAESRLLMTLKKKPFDNIVGKGENAGKQRFLLFPLCFLPFQKQISI